nr:S8 family peptidase [Bacteroidales bacterium]
IDYFVANAGLDADGNQTGPMRGGLVIFAAGNYGWAHDVPSEYESTLAVGAFGPDGKMALYSNYGPWVDILAPGGSDSEVKYEEWIVSLATDQGAAYMAGTSMACPHVAGVAALLVSYYGGQGFTCEELRERLTESAPTDVIDLQGRSSGGGKLDAYAAFQYNTGPIDPSQANIRISCDYSGDYRFKAHETAVLNFTIRGNERVKLPVRFDSDCAGVSATCTTSSAQVRIEAPKAPAGNYTGILRVGSIASRRVDFTILENHAPVIVNTLEDRIVNAASSSFVSIDLSEYIQDPDGEELTFSASASGDDILTTRLAGSTLYLTPKGYGLAEVSVTATDALQASCTAGFQLLARNAYQDLDVYPNPVSDYLYIRPDTQLATTAVLYSRSGARVLEKSGDAGPFKPLRLDVSGLAPGAYTLQVEYGGKQKTTNLVKQ